MARITIQIVEGFERGRVLADLPTPVSIGREEDNTIQLNDERVSRFHVKIQEDGGKIIITDLDSTNGTRINGHPVQMRVLLPGDQLSIGRSLLIFGSDEEIARQGHVVRHQLRTSSEDERSSSVGGGRTEYTPEEHLRSDLGDREELQELFPAGPPGLPSDLTISQAAQLSDVLAYVHDQIGLVVEMATEDLRDGAAEMRVDWESWQRLLKLEMQLAVFMRRIAEPRS